MGGVLLRALSEAGPAPAHFNQVAQLARTTAERMGVPAAEIPVIARAARLHDVGKVAIPASILGKPGPLDPAEWETMRTHAEIGERILRAAPELSDAALLVRHHHERHDEAGYPDRLAGDRVPAGSRVITVCAAFTAMMKQRPYSDAITVAEAAAELRRCAGTQFDPDVVGVFCSQFEQ